MEFLTKCESSFCEVKQLTMFCKVWKKQKYFLTISCKKSVRLTKILTNKRVLREEYGMLVSGFRMRRMGSLEKIRGDMGADATETAETEEIPFPVEREKTKRCPRMKDRRKQRRGRLAASSPLLGDIRNRSRGKRDQGVTLRPCACRSRWSCGGARRRRAACRPAASWSRGYPPR